MPNYVKGAFISMEDERFLNIMDSISKGQHVHYFQRLVNVRYKAGTITQQTVKIIITIMNVHLQTKRIICRA